ncbi:MAG: DUF6049 family protein [Jiangellaceae bacterium]
MRRGWALTAVVLATGLLGAPAARAQEAAQENGADDPTVRASLTTVEPALPQPGGTLTLGGTVENTGDGPLRDVQAILRYSGIPLDDRAKVRQVATDETLRWGQRYIEFFQELDGEFLPGETAQFQLTVPVDEINFGAPGVYAVGVDIRATTPDDERLTVDSQRTVVPWLDTVEPLPTVPVALLWPLAAQPSLLPDGSLIDDDLAADLADGGILSDLVAMAADAPVTWAVDPDLLATVDTMAAGYAVRRADGSTDEGAGADAAAAWLEAYGAATEGDQTLLLPYAGPDVQALAAADATLAAQTADDAADLTSALVDGDAPAVAWLAGGGTADEATLTALAGTTVDTVVLSGRAVVQREPEAVVTARAGEEELDTVVSDSGLDAAVSAALGTDPAAGAAAVRQGWLAETAMVALAAAEGADPAPAMVAAAPFPSPLDAEVAAALVQTWTQTPWIVPTPLADLPVTVGPSIVTPDPSAPTAPSALSPDLVTAVANLREQTAHYKALLAESDPDTDRLDRAAIRAASATWRTDQDAGSAYTEAATAFATGPLRQVTVVAPEQPTLSSNRGVFPLTIRNALDRPVVVRLEFTSDNPTRLSIADVPEQLVEAGEQLSVDVTAEAVVNGRVPVTVQLTSVDGAPLGAPQRMVVNATDYGTIGWLVVGGAVALLAGTAIVRLVRQRRNAGNADVAAAAGSGVTVEPEPLRETAR